MKIYLLSLIFLGLISNASSLEKKSFDDFMRNPNEPVITDPTLKIISEGLVIGNVSIIKDPPKEYISIIRVKNEKAVCFPSFFKDPIQITITSLSFTGDSANFSNLEMKEKQCNALLFPARLEDPGLFKFPIRGPFPLKNRYSGPENIGIYDSKKKLQKYCEKQTKINLSQNFNLKIKEEYDSQKKICEVIFTMGENIEFPKFVTRVFPENFKKDGRFLFETTFTFREFYFLNDDEYPDFYFKSSELKDGISYKDYEEGRVYLNSKDYEFLLLSRKQKDGNVIYEKISITRENYHLITPGISW